MKYDIVVIGGGPAGMAAAIAAKKDGTDSILILERDRRIGGILLQCIHNGFGLHYFGEELTGPEYAAKFSDEIAALGIEYKTDTMVLEVANNEDGTHSVTAINTLDGLLNIQAKAIVLSMGCRERTRGALIIPGTRPSGIFTAGAAQRFVNIDGYLPGKKVVILGSGDIGLIMARRLTLEGAEVKMICEVMPFSSGLRRNIVQCVENFNISLKFSHTITKIHGKDRLEGVSVAAVDANRKPIIDTEEYIECDTLLLSVGLIPENEISTGCGVSIDSSTSGPIVNEHMQTSVSGIFACGNTVHVHDLVDFVTKESIRAGKNASRYVQNKIKDNGRHVTLRPGNRVRYTVPQHIESTESDENISIMFRSTDVYKDVYIEVSSNGKKIKSMKKKVVRPGEMQVVELTPEQLLDVKDNLTVSIELPQEVSE